MYIHSYKTNQLHIIICRTLSFPFFFDRVLKFQHSQMIYHYFVTNLIYLLLLKFSPSSDYLFYHIVPQMINKYASHFMYCVSINFLFRALMKIYNLSITFSPTHISLMTTIIFGWGIFYDNRLEEDECEKNVTCHKFMMLQ